MKIHKARLGDIPTLVSICQEELGRGLLVCLGERFLYYFFESMIKNKNFFVLVSRKKAQILGFAVCSLGVANHFLTTIKQQPLAIWFLVKKIIKEPLFCKKIFEAVIASTKIKVKPQLLYLAVDRKYQRKGIGSFLLQKVKEEYGNQKVNVFAVGVWQDMRQRKFYEKTGGKFLQEVAVGQRKLIYYIYQTKK